VDDEQNIGEKQITLLIDSIFSLMGKSMNQIHEIEKETEKEIKKIGQIDKSNKLLLEGTLLT
jgi:hypothetical protein